jgi:hypothetical protein
MKGCIALTATSSLRGFGPRRICSRKAFRDGNVEDNAPNIAHNASGRTGKGHIRKVSSRHRVLGLVAAPRIKVSAMNGITDRKRHRTAVYGGQRTAHIGIGWVASCSVNAYQGIGKHAMACCVDAKPFYSSSSITRSNANLKIVPAAEWKKNLPVSSM